MDNAVLMSGRKAVLDDGSEVFQITLTMQSAQTAAILQAAIRELLRTAAMELPVEEEAPTVPLDS